MISRIRFIQGQNDNWGNEILSQIEFSRDLHASDAVYHQVCSVNFRLGRDKPTGECGAKKKTHVW